MTTSPQGPSLGNSSQGHPADDPSPVPAARLREAVLTRMTTDGWSVSDAAETGLSTSVMLNMAMVGASVNMTELFASGSATGQVEVLAFSPTNELRDVGPVGTVLRRGTPEVSVARHQVLDQAACAAQVGVTEDLDASVDAIIAAVAACVEQYRLLTV